MPIAVVKVSKSLTVSYSTLPRTSQGGDFFLNLFLFLNLNSILSCQVIESLESKTKQYVVVETTEIDFLLADDSAGLLKYHLTDISRDNSILTLTLFVEIQTVLQTVAMKILKLQNCQYSNSSSDGHTSNSPDNSSDDDTTKVNFL